ncbi:putative gram-negative bacteria binding protein [Xylariales sp. AK1849]|nr:putative gram-negative bacteria binding protein [Xylariales sp. AK1849]
MFPMTTKAPSTYSEKIAQPKPQKRFKSTRLIGAYEKPWLKEKDPRVKYDKIFFYGLALIGCGLGAYICYDGWQTYPDHKYCMYFEDDFSNGINTDNWNYEIQTNGFGTGSFDWTTTDQRNAYADASGLHIVPTFTTDDTNITTDQLFDAYTLNLTTDGRSDGVCTSSIVTDCSITSNFTKGTMINPIRSARLSTKDKVYLAYGKIEVTAKLPKGDWLWPAIWMMPQDSYYGEWPASGEIDIMESRGNDPHVYTQGRNSIGGTLHWGPSTDLDMYYLTTNSQAMRRQDFSDAFHTFGVVWTTRYILIYVDNILRQTSYIPFGKDYGDMYKRGGFASMDYKGGGAPANPWASSPNSNAPFDMPFYLILNVAVGGTNGYFQDGYGGKPWKDKVDSATAEFWNAKNVWGKTWGGPDERGMTVKSVKMWKQCG